MSGIIGHAGSKSGVIGYNELEIEEGTWTAQWLSAGGTVGGPTNSSSGASCQYRKIGRMVFFSGYINGNSMQDAGKTNYTGNLKIANFPFAADATNAGWGFQVQWCQNWDSPYPARGRIGPSETDGYLFKAPQSDMEQASLRIQAQTSLANGSDHNQMWFSGSYYTT